jgi:hypothetical protein
MTMKILLILLAGTALSALSLCFAGRAEASPAPAPRPAAQASGESPFACNMSALSSRERTRHFGVLSSEILAARRSARELPDGFEFEFPATPALYAQLTEWMLQERKCCPFFDLSLRLDRDGGPMWLRLTGREGVKEFIHGEFKAAWLK